MSFATRRSVLVIACLSVGASFGQAQIFVRNQSDIPIQEVNKNRFTENVDFADVDKDGDWDAAFSHGGDFGNIRDRIWINLGGLQGGVVGQFSDQTSTRYPDILGNGRDVEFVDFDGDFDVDIYISNTSTNSNQGNRWWTNLGGSQGGTLGFYLDETTERWVGLNSANSSISDSLLLPNSTNPRTFVDWSCDCDFGDLDNDGDMDLFHSTYGGAFGGQVPSRIFLNDGDGHFQEFNPSGFKLANQNIANGNPAIWCEGTQQTNTSNSNGVFADVATSSLDIDLGDIDGDFDIDVLHGDRQDRPRLFINRLEENGGTLSFRDRTGALFPSGYSDGNGHYEQEMGDLDGDGDLDIYGLNWQAGGFNFNDVTLRNTGNGVFDNLTTLSASSSDDNEGDFLDYDNDGDLDLYVANFLGSDKLYRNNHNGSGEFSFTALGSGTSGLAAHGVAGYSSLDADAADLDNDGDYDVISAQDGANPIVYWKNTLNTPDTIAGYIPLVESIANQTAGTAASPDLPVRAHVYDNAPYYITWYNPTAVEIDVDGIALDEVLAVSSGGQIFRAELPSNLVGSVDYRFRTQDEYGNSASSLDSSYTSSTGLSYRNLYGQGTDGSLGPLGIDAKSIATDGKPLYVTLTNTPPNTVFVQFVSLASTAPIPAADSGFSNVDIGSLIPSLFKLGQTDADGNAVRKVNVPVGLGSGFSVYWQFFTLDGQAGDTWASSEGLEINFLP